MTSDEFAAELSRGFSGGGPRAAPSASAGAAPADGVPLDKATSEFERILDGATAPEEVWRRFKRFAAMPIAPTAPEWISDEDGDLLLFDWVTDEAEWLAGQRVFIAAFKRQLALEGGAESGLIQIGCELAMRPDPSLSALEPGAIWSGEDREAWFTEVQSSDAFARLTAAGVVVLGVHVEHDV